MCGIAGFFSDKPIHAKVLSKMGQLMQHRGPDGEGIVYLEKDKQQAVATENTSEDCIGQAFPWLPQNRVNEALALKGGFVHRRLAIIAPDRNGHQPMCYRNRYWITYNGEIYNYPELREELRARGHQFQTTSDTEVVLAAFAQWGKTCLEHFNGMWAFVIYDSETQRVFAARDRLGVKPFYYVHKAGMFAFASEQKVLRGAGIASNKLNEKAVFDYLVLGEIEYESEGFYSDINELMAGSWLEFNTRDFRLSVNRYYAPQELINGLESDISAETAAEKTRELFVDAVRLRLRADVPVGSCLSGGIDSSAIVGAMRSLLPDKNDLHVFTAAFPDSALDESQWAQEAAVWNQCISHTTKPTAAELLADLDQLTHALDIPIWSTSTYAQFRVMRLASENGIRVLLDGQGGDELFGGYETHRYFYWKGLKGGQRKTEINAFGSGAAAFRRNQWMRHEGLFLLGNLPAAWAFRKYYPGLKFLNPEFYYGNSDRFGHLAERNWNNLNERLAWELDNSTLKAYLRCEDRCSMWHSVESRTPFADDHRLIEWAMQMPAEFKIHNNVSKVLLREATKTLLPEKIYARTDKKGYSTPNNTWIREIAGELKSRILGAPLEPFISRKKLEKEFDAFFHPKQEGDNGRIFKLISFACWLSANDAK
jgi:asparagine synthase (glutamine-hydrolysing)